ncbi:M10 family metallopeptidase C-terminal domain-containing protein [Pseudomonas sp. ICMP 460]|uniref:M10 family metallopeptidase C-terminal domain-containing protein n=1 Tax=Pseudomonas sp. ICMP 460 TaxID=1718917 RepID=UPI000C0759C9|nr:M10 family metallopeptidase C-terminal domain-containing protein [Pseudomonas sp. ICMP 460]
MRINQASVPAGYDVVQRALEENKRGAEKRSEDEDPSLTSAQVADRLNRAGSRWRDSNRNGKTELTYEFANAPPRGFREFKRINSKSGIDKVLPLSLLHKELINKAHQEYADVANLTFTEQARGASEGHLTHRGYVTGNNASTMLGFAYKPDPRDPEVQGTVWLRLAEQTSGPRNPANADRNDMITEKWRSTMIHELGHSLGLDHPHGDENEKLEPQYYAEDLRTYSIMSYTTPFLNDAEESVHPVSLMMDDMRAIQAKYGANYATRNGNTTYGFNSNTDRDQYSLKTAQDKPLFSVWDGGGWDTLDFSEFSQDQTINLNAGSFSSVAGLEGNVGIAHGVTIEEARGGQGKNTLIGNAAFNVLRGGRSDDIIYGGSGGAQTWGGAGANTFVFDATSSGKPNLVMDFVSGKDKLDLSGVSRQSGPLNFVSRLPIDRRKQQDPNNPTFMTKPGDVLVNYDPKVQRTLLRMDTTGDGRLDLQIFVTGKVDVRKDIFV